MVSFIITTSAVRVYRDPCALCSSAAQRAVTRVRTACRVRAWSAEVRQRPARTSLLSVCSLPGSIATPSTSSTTVQKKTHASMAVLSKIYLNRCLNPFFFSDQLFAQLFAQLPPLCATKVGQNTTVLLDRRLTLPNFASMHGTCIATYLHCSQPQSCCLIAPAHPLSFV